MYRAYEYTYPNSIFIYLPNSMFEDITILIIIVIILWCIKSINKSTIVKYKKKRVAVCISGVFNNFYEKGENIKKYIVDPLKADVFISTNQSNNKDKKEIVEFYKPKLYHFSSRKINNKTYLKGGSEMMFYRIHMANELKKKYEKDMNFRYDIVIRIRPDLIVSDYIPSYCINKTENNTIYYPVPTKSYFLNNLYICPCGGITDLMALGDSKSMDTYSSLFKHLTEESTYENTSLPEEVLYNYLVKMDINTEALSYSVSLDWLNSYGLEFIDKSIHKLEEGYMMPNCIMASVKHWRIL